MESFETFIHHIGRDYRPDGVGEDIEEAFTHEIAVDHERDFTRRFGIGELTDVSALVFV